MKRFIFLLLFVFCMSGLFAEDNVLYQKVHTIYDRGYVVALVQSDDFYYISIVTSDNTDIADRYLIYDNNLEHIRDLLFLFEKEKDYINRINTMAKVETLLYLKQETSIKDNAIINTSYYMYVK